MTPEAQRIAIAEACGYKPTKSTGLVMDGWSKGEGWLSYHDLPDYLNDLNAMHEAEKMLTDAQTAPYYGHLYSIVWRGQPITYSVSYAICHATAAQRAEAFLRTLNLWRDE